MSCRSVRRQSPISTVQSVLAENCRKISSSRSATDNSSPVNSKIPGNSGVQALWRKRIEPCWSSAGRCLRCRCRRSCDLGRRDRRPSVFESKGNRREPHPPQPRRSLAQPESSEGGGDDPWKRASRTVRSATAVPGQRQRVGEFAIVNKSGPAGGAAHPGQRRQPRIAQSCGRRLKVAKAEGGRRPAIKPQRRHAFGRTEQQRFIGRHVGRAIGDREREQPDAPFMPSWLPAQDRLLGGLDLVGPADGCRVRGVVQHSRGLRP